MASLPVVGKEDYTISASGARTGSDLPVHRPRRRGIADQPHELGPEAEGIVAAGAFGQRRDRPPVVVRLHPRIAAQLLAEGRDGQRPAGRLRRRSTLGLKSASVIGRSISFEVCWPGSL